MNYWSLYPMVGEVRDRRAVVLFELHDKSKLVHFTIEQGTKKYVVENTSMGPTRLRLSFKEDMNYQIDWYIDYQHAFRHLINMTNHVDQLICMSCDLLEADTSVSMWNTIENEVLNKTSALLHLGDQAYCDAQYHECCDLRRRYQSMPAMQDKLKMCYYQLYANRYCQTWAPHATVLSNTRNYFLWDDHEICNDVVFDPTNDIHVMASQCYKDYQASFQLDDRKVINDYCWVTTLNDDITLMAIERTSQHITVQQVCNAIEQLNANDTISRLILCFSSAPVPIPFGSAGTFYQQIKGIDKFWNQEDLIILLTWLFDWMDKRQIVICGGDLHIGVNAIYIKENKSIPLLISSPITNQPTWDRKWIARGLRGTKYLTPDIRYVGLQARARRCYGKIDLKTLQTDIVFSKEKYPKDIVRYLKTMAKF